MVLTTVLVDFYAPLTGICDRTIKLYDYSLRSFGEFLGRPATTEDLEELTVARWLAHRVRTMSAASAAKDRAQCRAIWDFCARRRLCDTWPQMPRVTVPERIPEAWLSEEMQQVIDSARLESSTYCEFPGGKVFPAILLLAYSTGERIGAIMQLKCRDVQGCAVIFRAEDRKGSRRDIYREISVECADALLAIRRGPDDTAIPWDKHPTYIYNRLKIILKRAGLPCGRRDKFHKVRRTTASYYEAAGGSAQRLLDHSSPAVTKRYLDPRIVKASASAPEVLPKMA